MKTIIVSMILLALSGFAITVSGAILSIHGILLFVPDKELYWMILQLAVAFEVAKITAATFLFHKAKDNTFPLSFKLVLGSAVLSLIIISIFASYVHLNNSVTREIGTASISSVEKQNIDIRIEELKLSKKNLEDQINNLPSKVINGRIKLYKAYSDEKSKIDLELATLTKESSGISLSLNKEDRYMFLNELSTITGYSRINIITAFLMFLVILIDPLAISLLFASTHLYSEISKKSEEEEVPEIVNEVFDEPSPEHAPFMFDEMITDFPVDEEVPIEETPLVTRKKVLIPIDTKEMDDE